MKYLEKDSVLLRPDQEPQSAVVQHAMVRQPDEGRGFLPAPERTGDEGPVHGTIGLIRLLGV